MVVRGSCLQECVARDVDRGGLAQGLIPEYTRLIIFTSQASTIAYPLTA